MRAFNGDNKTAKCVAFEEYVLPAANKVVQLSGESDSLPLRLVELDCMLVDKRVLPRLGHSKGCCRLLAAHPSAGRVRRFGISRRGAILQGPRRDAVSVGAGVVIGQLLKIIIRDD